MRNISPLLIAAVFLVSPPGLLSLDSTAVVREDTVKAEKEFRDRSVRSPAVALSLSAAFPGAGQIYNGSYWKAPVLWGVGGYFMYAILILDDYYKDFRTRYRESITEQNPSGNTNLRFIRDAYRDRRDQFIWYMGFLYIINLLDAYVDATLSGFDVGEDLSIQLSPGIGRNGSVDFRIRIFF